MIRSRVIGATEQIINTGMVKICNTYQDFNRYVPNIILIIAVCAAAQAKEIGQFLLRSIVVGPERLNSADIHFNHPF